MGCAIIGWNRAIESKNLVAIMIVSNSGQKDLLISVRDKGDGVQKSENFSDVI